jgi:hypothetical protein
MYEVWWQDGKGPQDAICNFLGSVGGSRASKEAFYNRLAKTADSDLPSEKLPVTVQTFDAGIGGSLLSKQFPGLLKRESHQFSGAGKEVPFWQSSSQKGYGGESNCVFFFSFLFDF